MSKRAWFWGMLGGLVLWLLIGGVVVALAQDDTGEPFATMTPVDVPVTETAVAPVVVTPDALDEIGEAVANETQTLLSGYAIVAVGLLFLAVVVIATPALVLLYRSAPPWTQSAFSELAKAGSEQAMVIFDRLESRAKASPSDLDDKLVAAIKEAVAEKLRELQGLKPEPNEPQALG